MIAEPGITREVAHQKSKMLPSRSVLTSQGQARLPERRTSNGRTEAAIAGLFLRVRRSPIPARTPAKRAGIVAEIRL